ncbi:MAG: TSUP family transporter [Hyphomicrobiaceae bacterium]|nr:TSUP family transporter [Hyphomicrobiaceae bacterium]
MGTELTLILLGALAGGFVSGLTGFGTGLTALAFWLHVIGPGLAAPLVVACSIIAQVQTLPRIWHELDWRRLRPFIAGGLVGVPIGTRLLTHIDPGTFKAAVGVVLIGYSVGMLLLKPRLGTAWGGQAADGIVGLMGGILGGLAGLSGPLPTIWAAIRGWGKAERRGVFQAFNLAVLSAAMVAYAASGMLNVEVGRLVLMAVPGTLVGAWAGFLAYRRLSDRRFHEVVLCLLALAGTMLIATG